MEEVVQQLKDLPKNKIINYLETLENVDFNQISPICDKIFEQTDYLKINHPYLFLKLFNSDKFKYNIMLGKNYQTVYKDVLSKIKSFQKIFAKVTYYYYGTPTPIKAYHLTCLFNKVDSFPAFIEYIEDAKKTFDYAHNHPFYSSDEVGDELEVHGFLSIINTNQYVSPRINFYSDDIEGFLSYIIEHKTIKSLMANERITYNIDFHFIAHALANAKLTDEQKLGILKKYAFMIDFIDYDREVSAYPNCINMVFDSLKSIDAKIEYANMLIQAVPGSFLLDCFLDKCAPQSFNDLKVKPCPELQVVINAFHAFHDQKANAENISHNVHELFKNFIQGEHLHPSSWNCIISSSQSLTNLVKIAVKFNLEEKLIEHTDLNFISTKIAFLLGEHSSVKLRSLFLTKCLKNIAKFDKQHTIIDLLNYMIKDNYDTQSFEKVVSTLLEFWITHGDNYVKFAEKHKDHPNVVNICRNELLNYPIKFTDALEYNKFYQLLNPTQKLKFLTKIELSVLLANENMLKDFLNPHKLKADENVIVKYVKEQKLGFDGIVKIIKDKKQNLMQHSTIYHLLDNPETKKLFLVELAKEITKDNFPAFLSNPNVDIEVKNQYANMSQFLNNIDQNNVLSLLANKDIPQNIKLLYINTPEFIKNFTDLTILHINDIEDTKVKSKALQSLSFNFASMDSPRADNLLKVLSNQGQTVGFTRTLLSACCKAYGKEASQQLSLFLKENLDKPNGFAKQFCTAIIAGYLAPAVNAKDIENAINELSSAFRDNNFNPGRSFLKFAFNVSLNKDREEFKVKIVEFAKNIPELKNNKAFQEFVKQKNLALQEKDKDKSSSMIQTFAGISSVSAAGPSSVYLKEVDKPVKKASAPPYQSDAKKEEPVVSANMEGSIPQNKSEFPALQHLLNGSLDQYKPSEPLEGAGFNAKPAAIIEDPKEEKEQSPNIVSASNVEDIEKEKIKQLESLKVASAPLSVPNNNVEVKQTTQPKVIQIPS